MRVNSGKLVYQLKSDEQCIEVREIRKIRWLHFGNGVFQTIIDSKRPHRLMLDHMPVMLGALNFLKIPQKILLLGLGGAGLVHYLRYQYPDCKLTVIEINSHVIDIARKYFYLPAESAQFTLINADAETYFTESNKQFDMIILDIFSKSHLPACCSKIGFYEQITQHLHDDGVLTANLLCQNVDEFILILQQIRAAFNQQTLCFPVTHYSNLIVYGLKSKNYLSEVMSLMECKALEAVQFDPRLGLCAKKIGK